MLDKKIHETIDVLIKKIKENNLGSIKLSNKKLKLILLKYLILQSLITPIKTYKAIDL